MSISKLFQLYLPALACSKKNYWILTTHQTSQTFDVVSSKGQDFQVLYKKKQHFKVLYKKNKIFRFSTKKQDFKVLYQK